MGWGDAWNMEPLANSRRSSLSLLRSHKIGTGRKDDDEDEYRGEADAAPTPTRTPTRK